ncbi:MAG: acyl-CoA carboxylase subunit epsilon [Candidatus Nanopelagicales bacterium]
MTGDEAAPAPQPLLRVVSGNPTPEELAAVVTVIAVAAAASGEPASDPSTPSGWGAPASMHRQPMPAPGPGAWAQLGRR